MNYIISIMSLLIFLLIGCRKEDNVKLPDLIRVPTAMVMKVEGTSQVIDASNPAAFSGQFTAGFMFENDQAQKADVVIMKNGNKNSIKVLQANVTTFPATINVTGAQLATLFGTPVVLGDKFDIGMNITTHSGVVVEAFPAVGNAYASGVAAQPGASTFIRYEAVCQYDPEIYQGNFVVVEDEWQDYAPGDVVQLTKIDATKFSFRYPADNAQPIIVTVNPNTNATSVSKQVYGKYSWGAQYGDFSVESVPGVENFVAPCQRTFSIVLRHTVAAGSFGTYKIVLRKQ